MDRLSYSECRGSIRCAEPCGSVVPRDSCTEVAASATAIASRRHVEQRAGIVIRITPVRNRASIHPVHTADERCADTGATKHQPTRAIAPGWTIYSNSGVGISDCGYVCDG